MQVDPGDLPPTTPREASRWQIGWGSLPRCKQAKVPPRFRWTWGASLGAVRSGEGPPGGNRAWGGFPPPPPSQMDEGGPPLVAGRRGVPPPLTGKREGRGREAPPSSLFVVFCEGYKNSLFLEFFYYFIDFFQHNDLWRLLFVCWPSLSVALLPV